MSSRPGSFFHGSAWPTQTMSAPALTSALHERLADRGLAVGDEHLAELRVAGHLAQHLVVCHVFALLGREIRSAPPGPARSSRAPTAHALRARVADRRRAGARSPSARRRGARGRAATAAARGRTGRCCGASRVSREQLARAGLRPPLQLRRQAAWQASRGGYCTAWQSLAHLQLEAALGGGGRHAERDAAARATAAGSSAACAAPGSCGAASSAASS